MGALGILTLLTALVALALAAAAFGATGGFAKIIGFVRRPAPVPQIEEAPLPTDVAGLRAEVAALRAETHDALRHLAVVRYDAFGDAGGHLSWSVALVDDTGSGVVLSSINARSEARSYAKSINNWTSTQLLSPEEEKAVEQARPKTGPYAVLPGGNHSAQQPAAPLARKPVRQPVGR